MLTCNDCAHWEACRNILEAFNPEYKNKNIIIHEICEKFQNKEDFVKVVRCKDCIYHDNEKYCYRCDWYVDNNMNDDDYCSYGERRE